MITFEGNKEILKSAQLLESKARNIYPHISTSRIRTHIDTDTPGPQFFAKIEEKYSSARRKIRESKDPYTAILFSLRDVKIGNCPEEAMLTEILGKINGQANIYTGSIGITRDGKSLGCINHVIAFITDENVKNGKKYAFKNKEAIIIDPWLGVTDYAGNYFNKLKSIYRKLFTCEKNKNFATFTNDNLAMELLRADAKSPKEFKAMKKDYCPTTTLSIVPFVNNLLSADIINSIKEAFPELVLKHFKHINLSCKKAEIIRMNVEY